MNQLFPADPSITLYDPLADLLGAGDGYFHYSFDDAVKLSGHACPTVAGAFLMALQALHALYGDQTPTRGGIRVTIPGAADEGVNGPISQVFTLLTGAASDNGFQGLGGQHVRSRLLSFVREGEDFRFQRIDNGEQVAMSYDPSAIPPAPAMGPLMQKLLQGGAGEETRQHFRQLWRSRVLAILKDAGRQTVTVWQ